MNLTFEAVRKIVQAGYYQVDLKVTNKCDYIMQIIENYIPQQSNEKLDTLICFRISDGYSKMKALFIKADNERLAQLQQNESLSSFPIIKVLSYRIVGKIINGEDFPILVQEFQFVDIVEKIIGIPISYKAYAINGFKNQNGATKIQEKSDFQSNNISEEKQKTEGKPKLKIKFSNGNKQVEETFVQQQQAKFSFKQQFQPATPDSKQQKVNQKDPIFFPLQQINPSFQQPFRGRIVKLNEIRSYQAKLTKKEGRLFAIQILDEQHMVLATFFDSAADQYYDFLVEGKCYIFEGAQVKPPRNPETQRSMGCLPYDFTFDLSAKITEVDDVKEIPMNTFNFIKLQKINNIKLASIVDVIVVLKGSTGVKEFTVKTRDEKSQRNILSVYDDSLYETEISLYGSYSELFPFQADQIYIFKSLKVIEYQGKRQLQSSYQTIIYQEGKINECKKLRQWLFTFNGKISESVPNIKQISQLIEESQKLELNSKIYSDIRAQLILIKSNGTLYYSSCTNCYKKAVDNGDHFYCSSCNLKMRQPKQRYILNCKIADRSGNIWISVSDLYASFLIDISADKMKIYMEENREKEKQEALDCKIYKEFRFKILTKFEEFNDQRRIRHNVQYIVPVSKADTENIMNQIEFYLQQN